MLVSREDASRQRDTMIHPMQRYIYEFLKRGLPIATVVLGMASAMTHGAEDNMLLQKPLATPVQATS